jgi:CheY-like chemotaxis protein
MHGGTVEAASAGQGKGSTFTVRLPVLPDHAERLCDPTTDVERPAGPRRRILVVDDSQDSATSMAMMLRLMGNEVRTAHDGVAAVEAAEAFRPQAILMDVGMPRLNGYDATQRIREQPWGRGMIIIALTGWGQDVDRAQSREAGCNGHLVKPVSLPELEKLLTELESALTRGESNQAGLSN